MYCKLVPTGFHSYVKQGGSTKPGLIDLQDETRENSLHTIKPFTLRNNQQIAATAKEIFGNLLAQEFDLPVPAFALTNFSNQFIQSFLNTEQQAELATRDPNWKYASQNIEGAFIFNLQKDRQRLREYDIAKLYAFDCLCFNVDRGGFRDKPNLLVDDESFWLIDHEQIFPFTCSSDHFKYFEKVVADFKNETTSYQYHRHLFYGTLKQLGLRQRKDILRK